MDLLTAFITPNVAALIFGIITLMEFVKWVRPQIKKIKTIWKMIPCMPLVLGVAAAMLPGVVDSPEYGVKAIVGVACAGVATMFRNMIKRTFVDKFLKEENDEE